MLKVQIKKRLGSFFLDVDFTAEREVIALLGASGCGKSMTLKCIAGIMTPDAGYIELGGRVFFDSEKGINLSPQARRIGYLFQQYSLFPNMTVAQNIAAGVRTRDKTRRREIVAEKIAAFQLTGLENRKPSQLSGGQQQRAALARMLAGEPELILLDEPLTALDDYLRWQVELELSDILTSFGGEAVYVSHSRDEVYRLCQSVSVLTEGRSAPKQSTGELFTMPGTLSASLLSGCKNYSRVTDRGDGLLYAEDWGAPLRAARPVPGAAHIGVRAHFITLCEGPGENVIPCTVRRVIDNMFSMILMLETPGGDQGTSLLRMELGKDEYKRLCPKGQVYVKIDPENVMALLED